MTNIMVKKMLLIGVIVSLILIGIWLKREFDMDRCLDRGGQWNFKAGVCEGAREYPSQK